MGDRCYLTLTICGHIKSLHRLKKVIAALDAEGLSDNEESDHMKAFAWALAFEKNPSFVDEECNYASIDDAENVLQEYGIAYHVDHGAGSEYSAGSWTWTKEEGRFDCLQFMDGSPALDFEEVKKALEKDDPVAEVNRILEVARKGMGKYLPTFSVSPELKRHLATIVGAETLSYEAA